MSETKQLRPDIIYRLVLAKSLFKKGIEDCDTETDIYKFSIGVISLHDALDNFISAIATQLGITLKHKSTLMEAVRRVEEFQNTHSPKSPLKFVNEIDQLNQRRNNIKHNGIQPNFLDTKALISPVEAFFHEYSQLYFNLGWDVISLAALIKNEKIKDELAIAESLIEKEEYKEALTEILWTESP